MVRVGSEEAAAVALALALTLTLGLALEVISWFGFWAVSLPLKLKLKGSRESLCVCLCFPACSNVDPRSFSSRLSVVPNAVTVFSPHFGSLVESTLSTDYFVVSVLALLSYNFSDQNHGNWHDFLFHSYS